jgi:hypothetical protein
MLCFFVTDISKVDSCVGHRDPEIASTCIPVNRFQIRRKGEQIVITWFFRVKSGFKREDAFVIWLQDNSRFRNPYDHWMSGLPTSLSLCNSVET